VLNGLDAGCEGQMPTLRVQARALTAACSPSPCTIGDDDSAYLFPARPCQVRQGSCKMGGELPRGDLPDSSITTSVLGVAVQRGGTTTFVGGLSLPAGTRRP
jgi:hypothetical protein